MRVGPAETPPKRGWQPPDATHADAVVHKASGNWMAFICDALLKCCIRIPSFLACAAYPVVQIVYDAALNPIPIGKAGTAVRFEPVRGLWLRYAAPGIEICGHFSYFCRSVCTADGHDHHKSHAKDQLAQPHHHPVFRGFYIRIHRRALSGRLTPDLHRPVSFRKPLCPHAGTVKLSLTHQPLKFQQG